MFEIAIPVINIEFNFVGAVPFLKEYSSMPSFRTRARITWSMVQLASSEIIVPRIPQ